MIVSAKWDRSKIASLELGPMKSALKRALRKAGATALKRMRAEASRRVRARKRIKGTYVRRALTVRRPKGPGGISSMAWAVDVTGEPVPLVAYPHRQTKKGVSVSVNRGKRTLIEGAFLATMGSGHQGVFTRRGTARLPIDERLGSRPVDALLHQGEADGVAVLGASVFSETLARLIPIEIAKNEARAAERAKDK